MRGKRQKADKGIIAAVLIHMQIKLGGLKQSH